MSKNSLSNKKFIYLVTSGTYSAYGVNAVFSSEQLAKKYISAFRKNKSLEFNIEKWALDPNEIELNNKKKAFSLIIGKGGEIEKVKHYIWTREFGRNFDENGISRDYFFNEDDQLYLELFAFDLKHAIKIAGEFRSQLIALNLWGVNGVDEN